MPSYAKSSASSPPPSPPWTVAFAQVVLGIAARSILSAVDLLERVHAGGGLALHHRVVPA